MLEIYYQEIMVMTIATNDRAIALKMGQDEVRKNFRQSLEYIGSSPDKDLTPLQLRISDEGLNMGLIRTHNPSDPPPMRSPKVEFYCFYKGVPCGTVFAHSVEHARHEIFKRKIAANMKLEFCKAVKKGLPVVDFVEERMKFKPRNY